ncbi:GNAT family N-acetyltransferase [Undibacterium sp. Di24W]|uniref:GNAT family N-acetyltransferase n=1 Tax=Undibacterium sp. Di24W TaxID=3413033 RepID=UPI003BF0B98D
MTTSTPRKHPMQDIQYHFDRELTPTQLADIFERADLNRPTDDLPRMAQMLAHGNLLITAWDADKLVGVARSLTDFCFCCYLSDLAVDKNYQHHGIGKQLITLTQEKIGPSTTLLLLAAPTAMGYYPKVGFEAIPNGWTIKRTQ